MEMKNSQRLTQSQTITITPRMAQALKLLQMNNLVLEQAVREEMVANPTLEEEDGLIEAPDPEAVQAGLDGGQATETERTEIAEAEPVDAAPENNEIDWEEFVYDEYDTPRTTAEERVTETYERVPVSRQTLNDYVAEQLRYQIRTEEQQRIGEYVIGSIDEKGYLTMSAEEIAEELELPVEAVLEVISMVQSLDPPGLGARDLRECLLLQLKARGFGDHLVHRVVRDHFDDLTRRRQLEIARALKVPVEDVQKCVDIVGTLSPVPGSQISSNEAVYVYPDLVVERVDEQYVVSLNDRNVPRLRISSAYESVLAGSGRGAAGRNSAGRTNGNAPAEGPDEGRRDAGSGAGAQPPGGMELGGDSEARRYVNDKLSSAKWLINTIEQRRKTMVKVMKAIVEEQRDFFDKGIMFLKPLTLQKVAQRIGMHESTVSRVTSTKYVQTPRGVFELKYFFNSGIDTDGGEEVSARSARAVIQKLIEQEDKKDPLSDQRIVEILKEQGLEIARRTVAKYRDQLNVPNARYRKRH